MTNNGFTFTDYIFEFSSKFNKTSVIFKDEISYKKIFENVKKKLLS